MKITSKHIAEQLGISQSTVSLALRNDPRIKDETRKRIMETADRLGYTPNLVSRSLVSGKTQTIAVLAAFKIFEHTGRMLSGMAQAAQEQGYTIKLMILEGKTDLSDTIKQCLANRVAGVIGISIRPKSAVQITQMLDQHQTPLVLLDSNAPEMACHHVLSDDKMGSHQAAEHLIGLGHRNLAVLTGHMDSSVTKRRTKAFWEKAAELLGDPAMPKPTELAYHINDVADHKTWALLNSLPRPTALFCTTDFMAAVALRVARSMGLLIPQDISIVGYGNLIISELTDPALTTVDEPFTQMGFAAMSTVLNSAKCEQYESMNQPQEILLPSELIIRQSTSKV